MEKEVIFHKFDFETSSLELGLEINFLNAHNFVWQGYFFFHYYLASSMTDWAQIVTGLLFYAFMLRYTNYEG